MRRWIFFSCFLQSGEPFAPNAKVISRQQHRMLGMASSYKSPTAESYDSLESKLQKEDKKSRQQRVKIDARTTPAKVAPKGSKNPPPIELTNYSSASSPTLLAVVAVGTALIVGRDNLMSTVQEREAPQKSRKNIKPKPTRVPKRPVVAKKQQKSSFSTKKSIARSPKRPMVDKSKSKKSTTLNSSKKSLQVRSNVAKKRATPRSAITSRQSPKKKQLTSEQKISPAVIAGGAAVALVLALVSQTGPSPLTTKENAVPILRKDVVVEKLEVQPKEKVPPKPDDRKSPSDGGKKEVAPTPSIVDSTNLEVQPKEKVPPKPDDRKSPLEGGKKEVALTPSDVDSTNVGVDSSLFSIKIISGFVAAGFGFTFISQQKENKDKNKRDDATKKEKKSNDEVTASKEQEMRGDKDAGENKIIGDETAKEESENRDGAELKSEEIEMGGDKDNDMSQYDGPIAKENDDESEQSDKSLK